MVLWDPAALPSDIKAPVEDAEILDNMERDGLIFRFKKIDSDHLLHVYVDQPLPERFREYFTDHQQMPALHVPGGKLWFAGAEDVSAAANPFGHMQVCHPQLLAYIVEDSSFQLPPGTYHVESWRISYPDKVEAKLYAQFVENRVGKTAVLAHRTLENIIGFLVWFSILSLLISMLLIGLLKAAHAIFNATWLLHYENAVISTVSGVSVVGAFIVYNLIGNMPWARRVDVAGDEAQRELPTHIIHLQKCDS